MRKTCIYNSSKISGLKDQAAVSDLVENGLHARSRIQSNQPLPAPFRYPQEEALRVLKDFEVEVMAGPRHSAILRSETLILQHVGDQRSDERVTNRGI
jgi:hypothetical protein